MNQQLNSANKSTARTNTHTWAYSKEMNRIKAAYKLKHHIRKLCKGVQAGITVFYLPLNSVLKFLSSCYTCFDHPIIKTALCLHPKILSIVRNKNIECFKDNNDVVPLLMACEPQLWFISLAANNVNHILRFFGSLNFSLIWKLFGLPNFFSFITFTTLWRNDFMWDSFLPISNICYTPFL